MKNFNLLKIVFVISIINIFGCSYNPNYDFYQIEGDVLNLANDSKVFLMNDETGIAEDSTEIKQSSFSFKGKVSYPKRYRIVYQTSNGTEQHSIWLENMPIKVSFDFLKPKNLKIIAGSQQKLDEQLEKDIAFFNPELIRLNKENKQDSIIGLIDKLTFTLQEFSYKNLNSYVAMESLYRIRTKINKDTLCQKLLEVDKKFSNSTYFESLELFCNSEIPQVGDNYLDFSVKTLQGQNIVLSELLKENKPVLIIFGGLQCMGKSGRKLLKTFNDTHKSKINTIAFVFAKSRKQWLHDESYNIGIPLVSDLEGDHSPIKIKYNVQATPTVYVIDKTGKISLISLGYWKNVNDHIFNLINKN